MPKGRGSNKKRKKREKDKGEAVAKGYLKLHVLYRPVLNRKRKWYVWDDKEKRYMIKKPKVKKNAPV